MPKSKAEDANKDEILEPRRQCTVKRNHMTKNAEGQQFHVCMKPERGFSVRARCGSTWPWILNMMLSLEGAVPG